MLRVLFTPPWMSDDAGLHLLAAAPTLLRLLSTIAGRGAFALHR